MKIKKETSALCIHVLNETMDLILQIVASMKTEKCNKMYNASEAQLPSQ